MDAKLWMDEPPQQPTAMAMELPAKVKQARLEHQLTWELAAHYAGLEYGMSASEVSGLCAQVRVWVEFQRRRLAKRMSEAELAAFRRALDWRPHMGAWRPFEGYMRDRKGEWKLVCAGALGAYDAAMAAMAGYDTQEFLDLCEHAARLCAELPEDWDPRHTERLWLNISEDWKVLHRGSPFARYIV